MEVVMKAHLLIVDPQNSFCDPTGELFVKGADQDMARLAEFIGRHGDRIARITVTLDSHNMVHIAHPIWWEDEQGRQPPPFTNITHEDVEAGRWRAAAPGAREWTRAYMGAVKAHTVWPYHCIIGSWGHAVVAPLMKVLNEWRKRWYEMDFVVKGACRFTEHFSAIRPAVEVPGDPSTLTNTALLMTLEASEAIWVAGEASSHCVADTVGDLVTLNQGPSMERKITLLADAMSPVPGFEARAAEFFTRMERLGVKRASIGGWTTGASS